MKTRVSPPHPRTRRGFTLMEVLVAMSVLVILVVLLAEVTSTSLESWGRGRNTLSSCDGMRPLQDRLAADAALMTTYGGLPAFPDDPNQSGRSALGFFITAPSASVNGTAPRALSYVQYDWGPDSDPPGRVIRKQKAYTWQTADVPPFSDSDVPTTAKADDTAIDGVLAFNCVFLGANGTKSLKYDPLNPARAAQISFIQASKEIVRILEKRGDIRNILTEFTISDSDLTNSDRHTGSIWKEKINELARDGDLPSDLITGIRPVQIQLPLVKP